MYPDDALLRRALLANAVFSGTSAVLVAAFAPSLAAILGSVPPGVLYAIAGVLALFALDLTHQARAERVHPVRALGALLGDVAWVAGSAALLLVGGEVLSPAGRVVVAAVALVVAVFAVVQTAGLVTYARNEGGSTEAPSRYVLRRVLDAPPEPVWALLRELDRIGDFYDALQSVEVHAGERGTRRTCIATGGRRWHEEILVLDDVRRELTLRFVAEDPDFPFPMKTMVGGWRVAPRGSGSEVTLWYEFRMTGGPVAPLLATLIGPAMERRMAPVLESLGREAARRDAEIPGVDP